MTTKYNELEKFKDDHKVKEVNETTEVQKVKTEMGGLKTRLQFADQAKNDAQEKTKKAKSEYEALKERHETLEKEYSKLKNAHERELAKIGKER